MRIGRMSVGRGTSCEALKTRFASQIQELRIRNMYNLLQSNIGPHNIHKMD
jgi:hypothetical protein